MTRELKRVAVFCGSNHGTDPAFTKTAIALGTLLAERGIGLVYGGGYVGLMGEVADATLAEGVGPGWDYYLDRLVAAETGDDLAADLAAIDFDDYFPALSEHYRRELA